MAEDMPADGTLALEVEVAEAVAGHAGHRLPLIFGKHPITIFDRTADVLPIAILLTTYISKCE